MADKVLQFAGDAILRELKGLLLKDNGDGTFALMVSSGAAPAGNTDVEIVAPVGQALKAASVPVVLASDQEARKWLCLGEQKITAAGLQAATLPAGTTIVAITATTAAVPYLQNGNATVDSFPVAAGCVHVIGPETLTSFTVFIANSAVANLKYYRED